MAEAYNKKTWTACTCLADHFQVVTSIPKILDAYVGCNSIEPKLNESIMVTVNSVNNCPYCTGLHGELARMAGVEDVDKLQCAKNRKEVKKIIDSPATRYARIFAEHDGRGENTEAAFQMLTTKMGAGRAGSVRALCWFLLWGSLGGNTINSFLWGRLCCTPKEGSNVLFELMFFLYYGILFLLIAIVNKLLLIFPKVPAWFSAAFGVLLTFIAGVWIVPVGIMAVITKPCHSDLDDAVSDDDSDDGEDND
mmetsp:Transcript_114976/g.245525  ORF Transcript_114976/g.245525 Transcript_114976/m.245525 type:complete len:251 (+) Transcript_114976:76-828(+)